MLSYRTNISKVIKIDFVPLLSELVTHAFDFTAVVQWHQFIHVHKDPACTLQLVGMGSATLLQLAFLGESDPHGNIISIGSTKCKKTHKENPYMPAK